MSRRVHLGIFAEAGDLLAAAEECRTRGLAVADAFAPHPVHGLDEALGLRRSRLPVVCFAAGAAGLALAHCFQYWASASDWPLDVGGKPFDSLPAFLPVAFEVMVLLAGLATAGALLVRSRLLPGARARLATARVTDCDYVLAIEERDASFPATEIAALFARHGARERRDELWE